MDDFEDNFPLAAEVAHDIDEFARALLSSDPKCYYTPRAKLLKEKIVRTVLSLETHAYDS